MGEGGGAEPITPRHKKGWSALISLFHANVNIREALLSLSLTNADDVVGGGGRSAQSGGHGRGQNPLATNDI